MPVASLRFGSNPPLPLDFPNAKRSKDEVDDIGTKRAVSYSLSDNDACKLTLTLAEVVQDDEVNDLTAVHHFEGGSI